jgi:hypothetical protein
VCPNNGLPRTHQYPVYNEQAAYEVIVSRRSNSITELTLEDLNVLNCRRNMKPNTGFLKNIIRQTEGHNSSLSNSPKSKRKADQDVEISLSPRTSSLQRRKPEKSKTSGAKSETILRRQSHILQHESIVEGCVADREITQLSKRRKGNSQIQGESSRKP